MGELDIITKLAPILGPTGTVAVMLIGYLWFKKKNGNHNSTEDHDLLIKIEADIRYHGSVLDEVKQDVKDLRKDFNQHLVDNA